MNKTIGTSCGGQASGQPAVASASGLEGCPVEQRSAARGEKPWRALAVGLLLVLAVGLVFAQTVRYPFVNFDDNLYVYQCPSVVDGLSIAGIAWAFRHGQVASWHPLTGISLMLDCQLYGLNAGGHHLTNALLHAATAVLLFLVLRRMTGRFWPSALVAGLFAVHPLRVESVAWVTERKDVLSGLFFMLTLAAYLRYVRKPSSWGRYLLVAFVFSLGMMAKQSLVTLPAVLLLLDYWPLGRWPGTWPSATSLGRNGQPVAAAANSPATAGDRFSSPGRLIVEKLPLLLLAAVFSAATVYAAIGTTLTLEQLPMSCRIGNALVSYVAYLGQGFWPCGLAVFYPHPGADLPLWKVLAAAIVLLGISAAALAGWRRRPYLLVGWLWYVGMLVPVIGLSQTWFQAMADRFTYLPQIGIYVALIWAAADLAPPWPSRRGAWAVASVLALAMFMAGAWRQTTFWRDSETLWIRALACTSRNGVAHQNLGAALADMNRFQEALPHYRQALEIDSLHSKVELHCSLAYILNQLGQPEEALAHYRKAVELRPRDAKVHYRLATTLIRLGRADEALTHYQRVVDVQPHHALAHCELGKLLAARGGSREASVHYAIAVRIWPACATAHCELGGLLAERGQCEEAAAHLQRALKLDPGLAMAHYHLANLVVVLGRSEEALDHYRQALKIRPDFAMAHCKLAWLRATCPLASLRDGAEAIEHALRACRLCAGKKPKILDTLAAAYAEAGSFPQASATAREALEQATRQNDTALADLLHDRIALYAAEKPFHQKRPTQSP